MQTEYQGLFYTVNPKGTGVTIGGFSPAVKGATVCIPESIEGLPVTVEAKPNDRPAIRELIVQGGVKLQRQAFVGLQAEHVVLKSGLELPGAAFEGSSIKSIHMEKGVRFQAGNNNSGIFAFCYNLLEIELPESIEFLPAFCFTNCKSLYRVRLPGSLRIIGYAAFIACASLPVLRIPEGVLAIGREALHQCAALESVTIPSTLAYLADNPFAKCKNLKKIYVPTGMAGIQGTTPLPAEWYRYMSSFNPSYDGITEEALNNQLYTPKTWKQVFKSKVSFIQQEPPDENALWDAENAVCEQMKTRGKFKQYEMFSSEIFAYLLENAAGAACGRRDINALQKQVRQFMDTMQQISQESSSSTQAIVTQVQGLVENINNFQQRFMVLETEEREGLGEIINACAVLAGYPPSDDEYFDITEKWRTLW